MTTYTPKTLAGAKARIRKMQGVINRLNNLIDAHKQEKGDIKYQCRLLARLAAEGPAFSDPLVARAARLLRDRILADIGLNPDGTPRKEGE